MSERRPFSVIVEGMEYKDETWTASGHVQMTGGREFAWSASHQKTLVVKLEDTVFPEEVASQIRRAIKSALGMVNLPYSRSFEIKLK